MELMIRQERKRRRWSQEYVANKVGVTLTAIQKVETGLRKPSFSTLVKIENLFCMGYRELFNLPPITQTDT